MNALLLVFETWSAVLIAVAFGLSLAHALEFPGKMRLNREAYLAMQSAYYPGFTVGGGIGEAGGLVVTFILLVLAPANSVLSWLTLVALLGLIGMQVGSGWSRNP